MIAAMLVMILVDLLLFWAPVAGPIVAGFLGGWVAGSPGPAFLAAILPAILAGLLLFVGLTSLQLPVLGGLLGLGVMAYLVVTRILLIAAAVVAGILAARGII
jgi:hypothetical protein